MAEAVSHAAWCSHSQPFDTALRAYSGQAVDLQEATSEPACAYPHADRPGISVAEYCLVINRWQLLLSAYAKDSGREPGDECVGRIIRSSKSEGG